MQSFTPESNPRIQSPLRTLSGIAPQERFRKTLSLSLNVPATGTMRGGLFSPLETGLRKESQIVLCPER